MGWGKVRMPLAAALASSILALWAGSYLLESRVRQLYELESQRLEVRLIAAPNAGPAGKFESYPRSLLDNKRGFKHIQSDLEQVTNLSVDPPQGYRGTSYEFAVEEYLGSAAERLLISHYKDKSYPSSVVTLWDTDQDCKPDQFRFVDNDNNTEAEISRKPDGTFVYQGMDERSARMLVEESERAYRTFRTGEHLQSKFREYVPKLEIRF